MTPDTNSSRKLPWESTKFVKIQLYMTIDTLWELWLAKGGVFCSFTLKFGHSQGCVGVLNAKFGCCCHIDENQDVSQCETSVSVASVDTWACKLHV